MAHIIIFIDGKEYVVEHKDGDDGSGNRQASTDAESVTLSENEFKNFERTIHKVIEKKSE